MRLAVPCAKGALILGAAMALGTSKAAAAYQGVPAAHGSRCAAASALAASEGSYLRSPAYKNAIIPADQALADDANAEARACAGEFGASKCDVPTASGGWVMSEYVDAAFNIQSIGASTVSPWKRAAALIVTAWNEIVPHRDIGWCDYATMAFDVAGFNGATPRDTQLARNFAEQAIRLVVSDPRATPSKKTTIKKDVEKYLHASSH